MRHYVKPGVYPLVRHSVNPVLLGSEIENLPLKYMIYREYIFCLKSALSLLLGDESQQLNPLHLSKRRGLANGTENR